MSFFLFQDVAEHLSPSVKPPIKRQINEPTVPISDPKYAELPASVTPPPTAKSSGSSYGYDDDNKYKKKHKRDRYDNYRYDDWFFDPFYYYNQPIVTVPVIEQQVITTPSQQQSGGSDLPKIIPSVLLTMLCGSMAYIVATKE